MMRVKVILMTAAIMAAMLVPSAEIALAQENRPGTVRCNANSAEKGPIGPQEEGEIATNPAGRTINLCPLTPRGSP